MLESWNMKKLLVIVVLGLFCSNNIYANDTYITIGTGGSTGVYFQVGNAMCKMVSKIQSQAHGRKTGTGRSYRCSAPSTGGSNFNIGKISQGNLQFGLAQSDWHGHAYNGTSKWKGKQFGDLRAVFSVHNEPFQIMVKKRKIKSFDDLRGKIVNIGNPGSGQRRFMEELLNHQNF